MSEALASRTHVEASASLGEPGVNTVPGAILDTLARTMKFGGVEWRVLAFVLANGPVTAWRVAQGLQLAYGHVKRTVRELRRWNILMASPEGLRFQPEAQRWGRGSLRPTPALRPPSPRKRPAPPRAEEPEEVVLT